MDDTQGFGVFFKRGVPVSLGECYGKRNTSNASVHTAAYFPSHISPIKRTCELLVNVAVINAYCVDEDRAALVLVVEHLEVPEQVRPDAEGMPVNAWLMVGWFIAPAVR